MIDRQDVFARAVAGLASQGFRRSTKKNSPFCMYRGPDNLKCAIGWVIPDDKYDPTMDAKPWSLGNVLNVVFGEKVSDADIDFCRNLQTRHDCGETPDDMKDRLREFALENHLTLPPELSEGTGI